MNHTTTHLWKREEEADIAVLITTYNRPDSLRRLLETLIDDGDGLKIVCRVYNDASDVSYHGMPEARGMFSIQYIDLPCHHGKIGYWKLINTIFKDVRSIKSPYFIQLPDDVLIAPGFFANALNTYRSINDSRKICLNLYLDDARIGRSCWTGILPSICKFQETSVFKTGWVDLAYLAEIRFFEELGYELQPIRKERWEKNPKLSSGVGMQISKRLRSFSFYQVRQCLLSSVAGPSQMNPLRPTCEDLSVTQLDPIVAGIASVPERAGNLRRAIESVLPFVDELHVYLNNYREIPAFLKSPKIIVYESQIYGDWGDAAKFFAVERKHGYYLAIDDDIVYPEDYVWKLVNEIRHSRKAGRRIAVGLHGKIMKSQVQRYYRDHCRQVHCTSGLEHRMGVHILGTGTVAFHTSDLKLSMVDFRGPKNMADIYFAIACQKQDVGCIVLPRPQNYIRVQRIPFSDTISGHYRKNDRLPTDLYNSWRNWRIRQ